MYEFSRGFTAEGRRTRVEALKFVIFHLMQRHLSDKPILRCVAVCSIKWKLLTPF